jgi:hypothetical protein
MHVLMSFARNSGGPEDNRPKFLVGWAEEMLNKISIDIFRESDKTIVTKKRVNKENSKH